MADVVGRDGSNASDILVTESLNLNIEEVI
jgi:hypothetical protein